MNRRHVTYGRSIFIPQNPIKSGATALAVVYDLGVVNLCKHAKEYFYIAYYSYETAKARGYFYYIAKAPAPRQVPAYGTAELFVPRRAEDCKDIMWYSCQTGKKLNSDDLIIRGNDSIEQFVSAKERQALTIMKKTGMSLNSALENIDLRATNLEKLKQANRKRLKTTGAKVAQRRIKEAIRLSLIEEKLEEEAASAVDAELAER